MSKKNKKQQKETTIEDFYDLKTDKVDELVAALKGETSEDDEPVSYKVEDCVGEEAAQYGEEREHKGKSPKTFNPYKLDRLSRVPTWIKAVFIKFWFAGMVSYLISMGLGSIISSDENRLLLSGLVLGVVVDFLVNPIFRYFESSDKEYNPYMMFPFPVKKFWTIFANIIYYILVVLVVNYTFYYGVNELFNYINGTENTVYLYLEPLLFGLFTVVIDMVFIGIKDLIVFLIKKSKNKKGEKVTDV